ncbi:transcriptional regulator [Microtetraspora sp. NBRC 16547]|uniref:winged helix-turn-helix domain-containing protein n=1 Tax=Microtetraspora sp. NBRC 16547 TaxID=3030993 RepID=UPI002554AB57|nr:transcriptional regulator [Microtetraspora sp. NBRC 16547]
MKADTSPADPGDANALHPTYALDDTVHQRVRLGILSIAREAGQVEFGFLKNQLAVTDGNLSRHLKVLENSGLIAMHKGYEGRRPRTWVSITTKGKRALEAEIQALRRLVHRLDAGEP